MHSFKGSLKNMTDLIKTKTNKNMERTDVTSSDSECDKDELIKLKEAAIGFNDVFTTHIPESKVECTTQHLQLKRNGNNLKPSLRPKEKFHEEENELETTPEFRAHVSKKLMSLVDAKLRVDDIWNVPSSGSSKSDDAVFKLFQESDPKKITDNSEMNRNRLKKKIYVSSSSSDDSEDERLAQAVVTTETILSTSAIHKSIGEESNAKKETNNCLMSCTDGKEYEATTNNRKKNDKNTNKETNNIKKTNTVTDQSISIDISSVNNGVKRKRKSRKKRQKEWEKNQNNGTELSLSDKLNNDSNVGGHDSHNGNPEDFTKVKKKKSKHKKKKLNKDE